jgi:hypothetical protein
MSLQPGQVFKVTGKDGTKLLLYKGLYLLKHFVVDITPGKYPFGQQKYIEFGSGCLSLTRNPDAELLATLKKEQIDRLMESPEGTAEILEKIGYHQATA